MEGWRRGIALSWKLFLEKRSAEAHDNQTYMLYGIYTLKVDGTGGERGIMCLIEGPGFLCSGISLWGHICYSQEQPVLSEIIFL